MRKLVFVLIAVFLVSINLYADERSDRTLEMLQWLSGNPSIWSGTTGANNITRINDVLYRAASQGPSENSLLYRAARSICTGITQAQYNALIGTDRIRYTGSYIETMALMERGNFDNFSVLLQAVHRTAALRG